MTLEEIRVPIDTGFFKSAGATGTQITEEQRAEFQKIVDLYFDDFVASVVRGRGMTKAQVKAVADGRLFNAPEAKALGLIDKIQPLAVTLANLQRRAESSGRLRRSRNSAMLAGVS